jgi:ADP-heptose:LPS heptosyltransferase
MKVLVIKLGAMGDLVNACSAFKALRDHYPCDELSLLTSGSYVDFVKDLKIFDNIFTELRPKLFDFDKIKKTWDFFQNQKFDLIYDLQMVDRTFFYSIIAPKKTQWIGKNFCKEIKPSKTHCLDRYKIIFEKQGIKYSSNLDLYCIAQPLDKVLLPEKFIVLVPSASNSHKGMKKWSEENFANLAKNIIDLGYIPVLVGKADDFQIIRSVSPLVIDLTNQTSIRNLIFLGTKAKLAIGSDTGPMIALSSGGCKTITLYSGVTKSHVGGSRSPLNHKIQIENLKDLNHLQVMDEVKKVLYE